MSLFHPNNANLHGLVQRTRPAFRRELRHALFAHAQDLGMEPAHPRFFPLIWATRIGFGAFGIMLVVSGAYAYESPSVNRISPFYFVKRMGESLEIAWASTPEDLAGVYLKLADRRLDEANTLSNQGIVDIPTIAEVQANTAQAVAAAAVLPTAGDRSRVHAQIVNASRNQVKKLTEVAVAAQVSARTTVIIVNDDASAAAPSIAKPVPPSTPVIPANVSAVPVSIPKEGTVKGTKVTFAPVDPVSMPVFKATSNDPTIKILNEAIKSSSAIADPSSIADPGATAGPAKTPAAPVPSTSTVPVSVSAAPAPSVSAAPVSVSAAPAPSVSQTPADSGDKTSSSAVPAVSS